MENIKAPKKKDLKGLICEKGYIKGRRARVKDTFCMSNLYLILSKISRRKQYKRYYRLKHNYLVKKGKRKIVKLNRTLKEFKLK